MNPKSTNKSAPVESQNTQSQIEALVQDRQGYLWSGTHHGLSRFDGHAFANFTVRDGVADNIVTAAFLDAGGTLWFGHPTGRVTTYTDEGFRVLPPTTGGEEIGRAHV